MVRLKRKGVWWKGLVEKEDLYSKERVGLKEKPVWLEKEGSN